MTARIAFVFIAAFTLMGCSGKKAEQPAAQATESAPSAQGTQAVTANLPQEITISDQKKVWECPTCSMDYDRAGQCTMCKVDLVAMNVAYICPADNKPVDKTGKCPRCAANARIEKTAAVEAPPSAQ